MSLPLCLLWQSNHLHISFHRNFSFFGFCAHVGLCWPCRWKENRRQIQGKEMAVTAPTGARAVRADEPEWFRVSQYVQTNQFRNRALVKNTRFRKPEMWSSSSVLPSVCLRLSCRPPTPHCCEGRGVQLFALELQLVGLTYESELDRRRWRKDKRSGGGDEQALITCLLAFLPVCPLGSSSAVCWPLLPTPIITLYNSLRSKCCVNLVTPTHTCAQSLSCKHHNPCRHFQPLLKVARDLTMLWWSHSKRPHGRDGSRLYGDTVCESACVCVCAPISSPPPEACSAGSAAMFACFKSL